MNAVAFCTYIINFSEFKLVSFMAYTYNMSITQLTPKIQDGILNFKSICSLTDVCTWNLRPGMNAAAFFTYIINFSEFKLVSFMAYTYNMSITQLTPKIQDGILTFESICSLTDVCTWNLRPGMNAAAFFTYIINFSDLNLVSFMPYTYNIDTGLAPIGPALWQPPSQHHNPTAPQPTFNLISINYDNVWLHTLNVVEGWMWIGKNSLNNFISHLSWLKKLSPTHTHPLIFIYEFSEPYMLLFFELESLINCWM